MSLGNKLARVLLLGVLNLGALCGVPVQPDKIQELMEINKRVAVRVIKLDDDTDKNKEKSGP